ncbi:hypothetical protein FACS189499_09730 [Clostridia bacterium]|nr:hypothetical protein FACS189499_09730 [Clostridia bacterium]
MTNLLKAEGLKLRKSFGFWILVCVFAAITIFVSIVYTISAESMATMGVVANGINGFYWAFEEIEVNGIFISLFSVIFICGEFSNRTIGISLFSGLPRRKMMFAKIITMFAGTVLLMSVQPVLMSVILTITHGFGASLAENAVPMLGTYALYLLGCITTAAVCALLAYAIRNVGGAIGACIGVNFFLAIAAKLPFESLNHVLRFSFASQILVVNSKTLDVPFYFGVMILTMLLALVAAAVVFDKSDLK